MATPDTSIIMNQGGVRPVDFAQLAQLGQQAQQHQMIRQMRQQQMQQEQAAGEQEAQLKGLIGQGGTQQDIYNRLIGAGQLDKALALQKHGSDQETTRLAQQKQIGEMIKQAAGAVMANPTEAAAISTINALEQRTGQSMDAERAQIYGLRGDPDGIKRWAAGHSLSADKMLPQVESVDLGGMRESQSVDPITGQVTRGLQQQKTLTPGDVQSAELTRRGQDMSEQTAIRGQDMRAASDAASLAAIQSKERAKQPSITEQRLPTVQAIESLDRLKNHPGSARALGTKSLFPTIPGSDAADFEAQLDTFKDQAFLSVISQMKGMGALSDAEGKKLSGAVGALSLKQSKPDFDAAVDRIKNELKQKYEAKTGEKFDQRTESKAPVGGTKFRELPSASMIGIGRRIFNTDTEEWLVSDGRNWVPEGRR